MIIIVAVISDEFERWSHLLEVEDSVEHAGLDEDGGLIDEQVAPASEAISYTNI